jgi:hypothetical protein
MCKTKHDTEPCLNYECPHNLFWRGLKLNMGRIHLTEKALRIRNCCRFISKPWTPEEIAKAWGLTKREVKRSEQSALRELHRRGGKELSQIRSSLSRIIPPRFEGERKGILQVPISSDS